MTTSRATTTTTTRTTTTRPSSAAGQRAVEAARLLPAVGHPPAGPDHDRGLDRQRRRAAGGAAARPGRARSAWSPTAAGGRSSGRRAAARPARPSGTPACSARSRCPCRPWSRCCSRSRFLAVAAADRLPALFAESLRTPGRSHRDPRPPGPRGRRDCWSTTLDQLDRESGRPAPGRRRRRRLVRAASSPS